MPSEALSPIELPTRKRLRPLGPGGSEVWRLMHDQQHTEIFAGGSTGPGKTFDGCLVEITEGLRLPGTIGGIFRSTAKDLRQSTLRTFFEVCECCDLAEGTHYTYNETKGEVKWCTGSSTHFDYLSYDPGDPNYSRLGGRAYTRAMVDEGDEVEERGVGVLSTRIMYRLTDFCHQCAAPNMADRSKPVDCDEEAGLPNLWECYRCKVWTKGLLPKLLITGNPGDYWTKYRHVVKEKGDLRRTVLLGRDQNGQENCWRVHQDDLPDHMACVLMLIDDNPDKAHVATRRKQLESGSDDYDKERLLHGNWMAVRRTGREFLHAFRTQQHVRRVPYDPTLPLHITFDFNTAPYMTLLVAQIKMQEDGRYHVPFLQELCPKHPEATTENACRALIREMRDGKYRGHRHGIYYYGDHSGKNADPNAREGILHNYDTVRKELRPWLHNHSDRVIRVNPSHTVVRDFYNSGLRGERKYFVTFDPSMTNTISDMVNVKESAEGTILKAYETDRVTGVRYQKNSHCLQASYYMLVGAFPEEFATFIRK